MFLFILESIGTPELILIAVVALIVLGPRKLPQMAKTVAKTMAEFRNATNEFKSTWEKEVAFEDEILPGVTAPTIKNESSVTENTISRNLIEEKTENNIQEPQIKQLTAEEIAANFQINAEETKQPEKESADEPRRSDKRDWL